MRAVIALIGVLLFAPLGIAAESVPGWRVDADTNAITRTNDEAWSTDAKETFRSTLGQVVRPYLSIGCKENTSFALVYWQATISAASVKDIVAVRYRLGNEPPSSEQWKISTDFAGVFVPDPIAWLKRAKSQRDLAIEIEPRGVGPIVATFQLTGIDKVVSRVAALCHWRP